MTFSSALESTAIFHFRQFFISVLAQNFHWKIRKIAAPAISSTDKNSTNKNLIFPMSVNLHFTLSSHDPWRQCPSVITIITLFFLFSRSHIKGLNFLLCAKTLQCILNEIIFVHRRLLFFFYSRFNSSLRGNEKKSLINKL